MGPVVDGGGEAHTPPALRALSLIQPLQVGL